MRSIDAELRAARSWPDDHPAWAYDRKLAGRALAQRLGIRVPALLSGPGELEDLTPPEVPAVLKPDAGSVGYGVLLLRPNRGRYTTPDGVLRSWSGVLDAARLAQAHRRSARPHDQIDGPWFVEAAVTPDAFPPVTYRLWTFRGGVKLVTAGYNPGVAGGDKRVHAWDPCDGWRPVNPWAETRKIIDPGLPLPVHGDEMLAAARRVLAAVGVPFLRIDVYDTADGPVFGEITPVPTWAHIRHTPEWDQRMGAAWHQT